MGGDKLVPPPVKWRFEGCGSRTPLLSRERLCNSIYAGAAASPSGIVASTGFGAICRPEGWS